MNYQEFLKSKKIIHQSAGINISRDKLNPLLFPFQKDLVHWNLLKGRSADFAATGLGKTFIQVEWSKHVNQETRHDVLILAPLAVSQQTVREAKKLNITITPCRTQDDVKQGINITNYEMLQHFNPNKFGGVVIDESSILKSFSGKLRQQITDAFANTPFRLSCTATPAPNDYMELGTQAEFLGVMKRNEMLAMFFTHDGSNTSQWRLKGHAQKRFWEWMASWAAVVTKPSDLGYENGDFDLPLLNIHEEIIHTNKTLPGNLFVVEANTLQEQREAARQTLPDRVKRSAEIVNSNNNPYLVWCNLNTESEALRRAIPDAIEVKGSDTNKHKEDAMMGFIDGKYRVLVSKPSICGFGMNFQHCSDMVFVGLSHSFEQYYQAVRRCWRFGQDNPVNVTVITSDLEGTVLSNIKRKERDAERITQEMVGYTRDITRRNVRATIQEVTEYNPNQKMLIPGWLRSEVC
jgi:hypothetical protein